jgi:phosphoribosylamine-glycine ligase
VRYVVFTFDGYGLPIALQLQREGHDVVVAQVQDQSDVLSSLEANLPDEEAEARGRRLSLYDGILDKRPAWEVVEELEKGTTQDDFLFFDLNQLFRFSERLQPLGIAGNYPTEKDFLFEIDRESAKRFVNDNYPLVRVGENKRFSKAAEGIRFLKDSDDTWVLKGLEEDARTIVPDVDDVDLARGQIIEALSQMPEDYESAGYLLERMIPGMLEFTPQRVYYDGSHVATLMVLENKELGAGDVGPMTDCAQDLTFLIEEDDRIAEIAFPPIVDEMAREHRGLFFWDASLLIEARTGKIYFGEFCANRPGYNALYNQMSLVGSSSDYFEDVCRGRNPYPDNEVGVAVRVFNLNEDKGGYPLRNSAIDYKPRAEKDLWLTDVRRVRDRLRSAGYKDTIGVATGCGKSVYEAARRAHRVIDEFSFEGAFYRPMFDLLSREYKTSILNRIDYGLKRSFYKVGFGIV